MKVILALILVSSVYSKTIRLSPQDIVLTKDLSDKTNEDYFITQQNHDNPDDTPSPDVLAQLRQYYLNKVEVDEEERTLRPALLDDSEIARSAYLLINTIKQRNKRYTSSPSSQAWGRSSSESRPQSPRMYLTLCHFKICNMGRKRTARYFHMIKSLHDQS